MLDVYYLVPFVLMVLAITLWILHWTTKRVKVVYPLIVNILQVIWIIYAK